MIDWLIDRFYIKQPRLRRAVTTLLEGTRPQDVSLLGGKYTLDPVREHGYLRASRLGLKSSLFRDEVPVLITLAAVLPSVDAFVDIGANVGIFSVTLAKLRHLYPLRFYAFEANPDTYLRLARNTAALGVAAFNVALSNHEVEKEFLDGAVSHVFTSVDHRSPYSLDESATLQCRRLDSFAIEGRRLLLKIDVEGQELEVLQGASGLFDANRVRAVYLDGYQPGVEEFLRSYGFVFHEGRTAAASPGRVFSLLAIRGALADP